MGVWARDLPSSRHVHVRPQTFWSPNQNPCSEISSEMWPEIVFAICQSRTCCKQELYDYVTLPMLRITELQIAKAKKEECWGDTIQLLTIQIDLVNDEKSGAATCRINYLYAICKKERVRPQIIIWKPYLTTGVIILRGKPNSDFPRIRKGLLSRQGYIHGTLIQHMFTFSGSI